MSYFRDSADQFRQAFLAMPMQSRVIGVLLVIAIAVSLGFLVRGDTGVPSVYLFGGQVSSENDLNAMEIAFGKAGLNGALREGRRMRVPAEERNQYLAALKDSNVVLGGLRSQVQSALESMSPFESSEIQMARLRLGRELDVATSIQDYFEEVRAATVTYSEGERRTFAKERDKSAAVMILPENSMPLSKSRLLQIQNHVARAFGMPPENVNVTDANSDASGMFDDEHDPLLRKTKEIEQRMRMKILGVLQKIAGVNVEVNATLDPTMDQEVTSLSYEGQPTTVAEQSRKISSESARPAVGGTPGVTANVTSNRATSLEENAATTKLTDDTKSSVRVTNQKYSTLRTLGLMPTKITATITIPTSYYDKLWIDQQMRSDPTLTADKIEPPQKSDLDALRSDTEDTIVQMVTPMLPPVAPGGDARPLVTVKDMPDLREPEIIESKTTDRALTWLADSWKTIALLMLGVFALLVARGAVRGGGGSGDAPREFAEGFGLELPAPPPPPVDEEAEGEKMTITGGSLKEELLTLVEANPEVAANVIRGWVGEAA